MQAGIEIGFDWQTALAISAQTVKELLKCFEEKVHPEQLIDRVTTPQGCTIAGLNEMEMHGFSSSLIRGIKTSLKQIKG
jgi:pyrroline-5-carboxylate reductase